MSEKQGSIIVVTGFIMLAMVVFPPFEIVERDLSVNFGFSFIGNRPCETCHVDAVQLVIQLFITACIGAALALYYREAKT